RLNPTEPWYACLWTAFPPRRRETALRARAAPTVLVGGCGGAWPAAAPGSCAARHLGGAVVAEVRDLRAAPGVGVRHPRGRTPVLAHFAAALITDEHRSPSHGYPSLNADWEIDSTRKRP